MAVDPVSDRDVQRLSDEVRRLSGSVSAIERRLAVLEGTLATVGAIPLATAVTQTPGPASESISGPPAAEISEPSSGLQRLVALAGRSLLVLGGAYFLRALTEAHVVPGSIGVLAGLLYASAWIATSARTRDQDSATMHALTATLIVLPILWEASMKFELVSPAIGAAALGMFAAAGLVVAAGHRNEAIAWIVALAAAMAAVALGVATRGFVSYSIMLTLLGVATVWLGYTYDWVLLRWPVALLAAGMMIGVSYRGAHGQETMAAFLLQILFFGAYLGSFAARTLFLGRAVIPFEVFQSVCVIVVGYGGAVYVTAVTGANVSMIGLLGVAFGLAAYAVAFTFVGLRSPTRNGFFYGALALTFMIAGTPLAIGAIAASLIFAALGVVAALLARQLTRWTLTLHATTYFAAAAIASGLLAGTSTGLIGSAADPWPDLGAAPALVFAAIAIGALCPLPRDWESLGSWERTPRAILTALVAWIAAGALIDVLAPSAVPAVKAGLDAGPLAALRTTVLVGMAIVLARVRLDLRFAAAGGLVYPLLILLGVKLLVEDMWLGRPSTLFVALGVYGAALIIVPRLMRQPR